MTPQAFQQSLLNWFDQHGRKNLPWQQPITPYRVWLSEIMLQQTQVKTVIPYFNAFITQFPDIEALANAPIDEVLALWAGLGYYARARNLHKAAQLIQSLGYFPDNIETLIALPGIGRSTAGAILSIAFHRSTPILDGNVKRVLTRMMGISGWPGTTVVEKQLWQISGDFTPIERVADYTQAIMDLGATACTRVNPACKSCPLNQGCHAWLTQTVQNYPAPKKLKVLPVKNCILLVLQNDSGEVLMERRPPMGIWGGLWSLPEFESEEFAFAWCANHKIRINRAYSGNEQRHTFSHYHLDFVPLYLETDGKVDLVGEYDVSAWYNLSENNSLGLPAPVKKLLQTLKKEMKNDSLG